MSVQLLASRARNDATAPHSCSPGQGPGLNQLRVPDIPPHPRGATSAQNAPEFSYAARRSTYRARATVSVDRAPTPLWRKLTAPNFVGHGGSATCRDLPLRPAGIRALSNQLSLDSERLSCIVHMSVMHVCTSRRGPSSSNDTTTRRRCAFLDSTTVPSS